MTTFVTIIAIIALGLFLTVSTVVAMRYYCMVDTVRKKNKKLRECIDGYIDAEEDCNASYSVRRINDLKNEYCCFWAVCRTSIVNRTIYNTWIKVFCNGDDEFNKREAEALCDMLNSKSDEQSHIL